MGSRRSPAKKPRRAALRELESPPNLRGLKNYFAANRVRFVTAWQSPVPAGPAGFHGHTAFEIVCHVNGAGTLSTMRGDRMDFDRPCVMLLPPRIKHAQQQTRAGEDLCILFRTERPAPARLFDALSLELGHAPHLISEIREILRLATTPDALTQLSLDYRVTALLLQIWTAKYRSAAAPESSAHLYATRAHDLIQRNSHLLRDAAEVARELNISYDYLRHVFKRTYHMGLARWLMVSRVEYAKTLVVQSNLPLKAVARACGFPNEQHFCRKFHEIAGMPPGAFRTAGRA